MIYLVMLKRASNENVWELYFFRFEYWYMKVKNSQDWMVSEDWVVHNIIYMQEITRLVLILTSYNLSWYQNLRWHNYYRLIVLILWNEWPDLSPTPRTFKYQKYSLWLIFYQWIIIEASKNFMKLIPIFVRTNLIAGVTNVW